MKVWLAVEDVNNLRGGSDPATRLPVLPWFRLSPGKTIPHRFPAVGLCIDDIRFMPTREILGYVTFFFVSMFVCVHVCFLP